jgi:cytochrome oxidase Cu insertion factor (SCO1/SenC/PrrC family)
MRMRGSFSAVALALVGLVAAACGSGGPAGSPTPAGNSLEVGDPAPGFTLPSAQGDTVSLAQFRGHKPVLLYFSMGPG